MFKFNEKVVVITGASSGLGKQMAEGFAKQGANLAILARREERLFEIAKNLEEHNVEVLPVKCDVTDENSIEEAKNKVMDKFKKIDVLINCAGGNKGGSVYEMSTEDWNFTIELDLTSIFKVSKIFMKPMMDAKYGRIINIASMYGLFGTNQQASAYHAAKAGVINLTRATAAELAPYNITVNAICPGFFKTELTADTLDTYEFKQYMNFSVPMGRPGNEGELNAGAIFLASEEASYITGVTLPIDGGWSSSK
ncbi:SDR family NAD(P)-dependent oxidoreductase [Anaerosphaera multitolerans]|uniref:SDR family oxidoreductase n=1 Tax=Anaerosphaera multitolerans TaxID=2487351 RepID=A0A437S7Q2_9FIRM|nr:SDR family NAD(P)-dependent oxidoreductase [Anaerosphaera multitolerans]RVU55093.1 SDR family oxidoreductase [Anaerosphaera multitolerans]